MMKVSMQQIFSGIDGRIVFKPIDVIEENAKDDKTNYVRYTR